MGGGGQGSFIQCIKKTSDLVEDGFPKILAKWKHLYKNCRKQNTVGKILLLVMPEAFKVILIYF